LTSRRNSTKRVRAEARRMKKSLRSAKRRWKELEPENTPRKPKMLKRSSPRTNKSEILNLYMKEKFYVRSMTTDTVHPLPS